MSLPTLQWYGFCLRFEIFVFEYDDLQSPTGRNFFLSPQPIDVLKDDSGLEYPLAKVIAFTEHKDKIRRSGVASTVKCAHFPTSTLIITTFPEIAHFTLQDIGPFSVLSP